MFLKDPISFRYDSETSRSVFSSDSKVPFESFEASRGPTRLRASKETSDEQRVRMLQQLERQQTGGGERGREKMRLSVVL